MPSKIRVLDEDTINKIAAGEVIENPSSVIKELVENSLDAGATEITIEIKGGGRQLIRITDNGSGMSHDDALLCLERHATSKLKEIEDIHLVGTMGFRGEAIPSIASISKFTLYTREAKSELGTLLIVEGGKIINCSQVECAFGTTIEVKDLFFNVPVRKKFQKSPNYDIAEIQRIVTLLALGYPYVHFRLISNQETLVSAPLPLEKTTFIEVLGERIRLLLGNETFNSLESIASQKGDLVLEGFIGSPMSHRHNRSGQYLFINKRAVVVPLVSFAVRDGYGTMLPTGRHPIYILHLTTPSDLVDVNVHPQKREVRLRQERVLKELIFFGVEEALQNKNPLPLNENLPLTEVFPSNIRPPFPKLDFAPPAWVDAVSEVEVEPYIAPKIPEHSPLYSQPSQAQLKLFETKTQSYHQELEPLKALGTLQGYIIAVKVNGQTDQFHLIDQRAAHSRIIYEKLLNTAAHHQELQMLLIPHLLDLPATECIFLRSQLNILQAAGIQIKEFGPTSFVIDALPQIFGNVDIQKLIDEIIKNSYEGVDPLILEKEQKRTLALAASRAAIAAKIQLNLIEAQKLLDQLTQCTKPKLCPQGKNTMKIMTTTDIGKLFQ